MGSRWEVLSSYSFSDTDYLVFAKRKRNGLIKFKTVRVHGFFSYKNPFFKHNLIDIKEQWDKILKSDTK